MRLSSLYEGTRLVLSRVISTLEGSAKHCFRPTQSKQVLGTLADITRSKSELIAENAFLRQQLLVLQRQTKRPVLTPCDRTILVILASRFRTWRQALVVVSMPTSGVQKSAG
jgi:hypothetical protein